MSDYKADTEWLVRHRILARVLIRQHFAFLPLPDVARARQVLITRRGRSNEAASLDTVIDDFGRRPRAATGPREWATSRFRRRTVVLACMLWRAGAQGPSRLSTCKMPVRRPRCPTRQWPHSWEPPPPLFEQRVRSLCVKGDHGHPLSPSGRQGGRPLGL